MRKRAHSLLFRPKTGKTGSAHFFSRAQAAPRPQPRPGPAKSRTSARLPGPRHWPIRSRPSILIRRPSAHLAENKSVTSRTPGKNPRSFSFFPALSLSSPHSSLFTLSTAAPSDELRRRERAASPGAVAGPLAGVRAPQRVSAPPSSGLAAAPLWPDPGERSPGRPFFSPTRRRDCGVARRRGRPPRSLSFPFFDSFVRILARFAD